MTGLRLLATLAFMFFVALPLNAQSPQTSRYSVGAAATQDRGTEAKVVRQGGFPTLNANPKSDTGQPVSESQQGSRLTGNSISVVASLTVVLGLFAGFVWMTRRFGGAAANAGALPAEVFANLGSTPLDPRTRITLLRCGSRLLVVSQTATGTTPIAEITDVDEVQAITAACTGESKTQFLETLRKFESQPAAPGFAGDSGFDRESDTPKSPPRSGRLFANA